MTEEDVEYIGEESNKDPDADKLKKLSELGLLIKKPHSIYPKLNRLFISELEETKYLECSLCFKMFTNSGGHVSKHATKRCKKLKTSTPLLQEFIPVVKLSNDQKKKLCQLEARLAIECGLSFNKVTSEGFNRYTMGIMKFANMKIDGGLINSFPTRNFVKEEACHYSEELIRKYKEEIMERINKAHVALSIDFGLNQRTDYLALFISYIRESEEGWKLMTVPVGLIATTIEKTAQNISTMIGEQLEYFGVDKEQCKQIKVTGDAASNVKACANDYFGGYIKCSCHFLNTIAKRICEPYALLKEELGEDALGHLKNFESFLSRATSFITIIKNSHKISSKLNLFLRQPVSTRWCTKLHVLEDLLKAIPTLFEKITDLTREMANELIFFHGNKDILEQMIELLKPFEIFIVEFETTKSITLHKVAPALFYLKNYMEDKKISYELSANEKFVCFCKSALLSIDYHIKESLSMEHYKASFLCPGTKKMKKIPEIMRRKTVEHIRNLLKVRKPASPKEPTTKRFNIEMDSSDDEDEKDEISLYLADTSGKHLTVENYWPQYKETYSGLYRIALETFSCLPAEAACERAFSVLDDVIPKRRSKASAEVVSKAVVGRMLYTISQDENNNE